MEVRLEGLDGFSTQTGPTFDGGSFAGGGPVRDRILEVRLRTPFGRPASVELDLIDTGHHGCTVSLPPDLARQVAAALTASADKADAERQKWLDVVNKQNAKLREEIDRQARAMAGLPEEE